MQCDKNFAAMLEASLVQTREKMITNSSTQAGNAPLASMRKAARHGSKVAFSFCICGDTLKFNPRTHARTFSRGHLGKSS
jgi:hypothetical protein